MTKLEKLEKEYLGLSFEDKKAKLTTIFERLQGGSEVFDQVLDALRNNPNVDDKFLVDSYRDIMELAVSAEEQQDTLNIEKMGSRLAENMKILQEKEAQDRAQENAEDILNDLN